MEETAVFSEIDITEQDISLESTKIPNDYSEIVEPTNFVEINALLKTEKDEHNKSESSFGHDVSDNLDTKILNEDMMRISESVEEGYALSLDTEKYKAKDREMFSESNFIVELSTESKTSNETTKSMPSFQFSAEHDLTNESKTSNKTENSQPMAMSRTCQDISPKPGDLNVTVNFNELKETEGQNEKIEAPTANSKTLKPESSSAKSRDKLNRFTILHEDDFSDSENGADISMVSLLRGTINELERGLRDSRALIKTRDEDIASLRKEVEKGREQIHKEQIKWQRKYAVGEERGREIQELKKKLLDSEKTVEELSERIKEFESPCSESDDIVACCSSMKELLELKMELVEKDEIIKEIQKNNPEEVLENAIVSTQGRKAKEKRAKETDQHNQLKLKFLRDAFFYFMIDFHSEEQMKAILAVLSYGDQREDVIYQAYRMRQRGKKFAVKEVSSRGLAFLHEES